MVVAAAIVVDRGKRKQKIRVQFHTRLVVRCRMECGPGFAATVNNYKNVLVLN